VKTFAQFLTDQPQRSNLLFENGMYSLNEDLERLLEVLEQAGVPYEIIGRTAVLAHVMSAQKGRREFLTKDIHVLMNKDDLEPLITAAKAAGYHAFRIMDGYALVFPPQELEEGVHIIFAGERPRPQYYKVPSPPLHPEQSVSSDWNSRSPGFGIC
jgi:hypothetical protein